MKIATGTHCHRCNKRTASIVQAQRTCCAECGAPRLYELDVQATLDDLRTLADALDTVVGYDKDESGRLAAVVKRWRSQ